MTIYQDWSNCRDSSKIQQGLFSQKLQKSSCQKQLKQFLYNLAEMFLWWPSIKIAQAIKLCQNAWLPRGRINLLSIYIYMENLKKPPCKKPLDRFQYNLTEMFFWWPSTKIVQAIMTCQKPIAAMGRGFMCLFIYIKIVIVYLSETAWPISI